MLIIGGYISNRVTERLCKADLKFIVLAVGRQSQFTMIANFVILNCEVMSRLFNEVHKDLRKKSNSYEPCFTGLVNELTDVAGFKKYFHTKVDENQNRGYMFSNYLNDKALKDMVLEFETFKETIIVLLLDVDIQNNEVVSFLHRFKTISIALKGLSTKDYMGYKDL